MTSKPNILFLMADQMQGRVFEPGHPCLTPNFDRLIQRGVRFTRAYTPNAVCSPARASLMTGLLPHNHGVLTVTHTVSEDQSRLRTEHPHWAQRLDAAGYRTGYFGKWHVEEHQPLTDFGWQVSGEMGHGDLKSSLVEEKARSLRGDNPREPSYSLSFRLDGSTGYPDNIFYGVTDVPPEQRNMGVVTAMSLDFLDEAVKQDDPWCCFVSVQEPHDPFIAGQAAFDRYDVDALPLSENVYDDLAGRPNIYRKSARVWAHMTDDQKREAAACYYASITEIDQQFGRILDRVEVAGQMENTIVVLTSDHGELLGAHGMYCKNFSAYEEIYNIPLIVAGPDMPAGVVTNARVGSHDLCPTLLDLVGCPGIENTDSHSFAPVLKNPQAHEADYTAGYAEYFGGRMILTQRVAWDGPWKFVFNGFDFDELYHLDNDPQEMNNLAEQAEYADRLRSMTALMWRKIEATGDHSLGRSKYPPLRVAPYGPGI